MAQQTIIGVKKGFNATTNTGAIALIFKEKVKPHVLKNLSPETYTALWYNPDEASRLL